MNEPTTLRTRAGAALLIVGLAAGCRTRAPDDRHAAPEKAAPPPAPTAVAAPAPEAGLCHGKQAGEHACAGRALLRCDGGDGAGAPVRTCFDIERCDADHGTCAPACPPGEVYVPATGPQGFTMGRGKVKYAFGTMASHNPGHGIADTPHQVVLTRPFCMDATEVTAGAYARCVAEKGCTVPDFRTRWIVYPDRADYPVNMVHWHQAKHYCDALGQALPTEAQWEWAATGGDGRKYPWGDAAPTCEQADFTAGPLKSPACDCGCSGGGASPVGSHPAGDKEWPSGRIHDLAGNVWEWCLDNYAAYKADAATDPLYRTGEEVSHVVRGGGWNRSAWALTTSFRGTAVVGYQRPALGFRCVRNPG